MDYEYDVALSFAGENREYVRKVADCLKNHHVRVFYDEYEEVSLWGKNLYNHLREVYEKKARYTVMFISSHYAKKLWTNHERESAQARAFSENEEYILPVRFDETEIPGLLKTVGYISLMNKTPEYLCKLICHKLDIKLNDEIVEKHGSSKELDDVEIFFSTCHSLDLTASLLSQKWSLEQLNSLVIRSPKKGSNILRKIAADSDTWKKLLGSFICAKTKDPSQTILEIAFDENYSWSARTTATTWLRFCHHGIRETLIEKIKAHEDGDFDNIRLVIACMGFCGYLTGLPWLLEKYPVMKSDYDNEKLGPFLILAFLDCHAIYGKEWLPVNPLKYMTDVIKETEKRSNMHLGFFEFHQRLQTIDRGLLIKLIQHLYKEKHEIMLEAALAVFETRPSPALLPTLNSILMDPNLKQISRSALMAIAHISSNESEKILHKYQKLDVPGVHDALILWVGLNKRRDYLNYLIDCFNTAAPDSETVDRILWSIGELAKIDPELVDKYLFNYAENYDLSSSSRAMAWLGLAKAKKIRSKDEIALEIETSTEHNVTLILSMAACIGGYPEFLEKGIHASQLHHSPVWRLQSHLHKDFTKILMEEAGQGGRDLKILLDLGHLD